MSKIFDAQDRIVSLLKADAYFADLPVISQREGELLFAINQTLQTIGIGVVVMLPRLYFAGKVNQVALELRFVVVVSERPTQNVTGKPAEAVMEKIFKLIHWQPNNAAANPLAQSSKFHIGDPAADLAGPTVKQPALLNYLINFRTIVSLP